MPVAYWVISWKYSDSWKLWVIVFTKMKQRNECGLDEEAAKNSTADLSRGPWQWVESPGTSFLLFMNLNFPEDAWTKSVLCTLKPTWAFVPEKTKANFFVCVGRGLLRTLSQALRNKEGHLWLEREPLKECPSGSEM